MTAIKNMAGMKLKIRIGSKQIGADPVPKQYELNQGVVLGTECRRSISMSSLCNNKSEIEKPQNLAISSSDTLKIKFSSSKRGLSEIGDGQKEKRRKMDRSVTQQCASLVKRLMSHPAGWVFKQPVDAVKLQLPDYHHVITHPMDLGTVKAKLNKNEYSSIDEYAADVRLTFSNAMTYNPPGNTVHTMAKELNDLFNLEWSALETKWSSGRQIVQQKKVLKGIVKCTAKSAKSGNKGPPNKIPLSDVKFESKKLISVMEKQELKQKLFQLAKGKVPSHLQGFLKKLGFESLDLEKVDRIEKVVDVLGDEDLWELRTIVRSSWVVQPTEVLSPKKPEHLSQQSRLKIIQKGNDNGFGNAVASATVVPPPNSVNSECGSCRGMKCECNKQSDKAHATSDISSEGSKVCPDVSMRDCGTKSDLDSQLSKSDLEPKGAGEALNEDPIRSCPPIATRDIAKASVEGTGGALNEDRIRSWPPISTMDTAKASVEGAGGALKEDCIRSCPPISTTDAPKASAEALGRAPQIDVQLPPQKALRAALLKSRFADTILKAKQKALLDQGEKADPAKLQQEKERLERQQQEERVKLEAQIRASEEAARVRAEAERKMVLEREREAARLAMQQMVKTVEIVNDHKIVKDLELLSGCSLSDQLSCVSCESSPEVGSGERGQFVKALEKLGLFMKVDYMEDEDEDSAIVSAIVSEGGDDGAEEGEIFP